MRAFIKTLSITCLVVILTGCTSHTVQKKVDLQSGQVQQSMAPNDQNLQLITVSAIESVQIKGGLPGRPGSELFKKTDAKGSAVITRVAGWINASIPTDGPTNFGKHGYPQVLEVIMANGDTASVEPAYNCVLKTNADGSASKSCSVVKREVIYTHNNNSLRLISPDLYDWLQEGWKQEK